MPMTFGDARKWRARAQQMRDVAECCFSESSKEGMLDTALIYEQLADDLEFRLRRERYREQPSGAAS